MSTTMASAPRAQRAGGEFALDGGEGIVERVHEDAAHGVDHQDARAVLASTSAAPRPGVPRDN